MPSRAHTNTYAFYKARYDHALEQLDEEGDAAERTFLDLLHHPQLPLYMRAQCNSILACIENDVDAAASYLRDARHVLDLFEEQRPRDMNEKIIALRATLDETERDIDHRRDNPSEEDADSAEEAEEDVDEHDEMLLGYYADPVGETADEDDEMLLGADPEEDILDESQETRPTSSSSTVIAVSSESQTQQSQDTGSQTSVEDLQVPLGRIDLTRPTADNAQRSPSRQRSTESSGGEG